LITRIFAGDMSAFGYVNIVVVVPDWLNADDRRRPWVPGVSSPGKPNDYINMFLEEIKIWLRQQLTLDNVSAEELSKREKYFSKLKNDNYYWYVYPLSIWFLSSFFYN
jgi:hypothetical protein